MASQWVYYFGEGENQDKKTLGGKGLGLSTMTKIGLPVPPGFTITTQACIEYTETHKRPENLKEQVETNLKRLLKEENKTFGQVVAGKGLLLLSVRSGAAISMPGMMDTVLNLGLNDKTVVDFAVATSNERFAWDSYRRFIAMFGDVVMGVEHLEFEAAIGALKSERGIELDTDFTPQDLMVLVERFKAVIQNVKGCQFPQDPYEQLWMAIDAVFDSWSNERAIHYRVLNGIPHSLGTAVNVQAMVFGNMGDDSGTGVAFTRNPATGKKEYYGEYLENAQGEDVVAGIRTPKDINEMVKQWPSIHKQLTTTFHLLEQHYKEMQDCEFTIEKSKLYMLQTRKGKRTAAAAVRIAVEMHKEGLMTKEEALLAVEPNQINQLLHKQLDPKSKAQSKVVAKGLPASPGAAVGIAVFSAADAVKSKESEVPCVLVRLETSPEDIAGMDCAEGVLTARGGMTSHAAVVARGMGKCCVSGCTAVQFTKGHNAKECTIAGKVVKEGDFITLDGATGEVFLSKLDVVDVEIKGDYATIMEWADEVRTLQVRTNADTPADAAKAITFGAQGIGLVRTEHMFFAEERITPIREMILASSVEGRQKALDKLLPFQQKDFEGLFSEMSDKPVIIRLLDPPLHEFLPHEQRDMEAVAAQLGLPVSEVQSKVSAMSESNPMLGFRGCRLGVVYPEITKMQVTAIFQAALAVIAQGKVPLPEIEVPLVGCKNEFMKIKAIIKKAALDTGAEGKVYYQVGTMIEVPRAALTADDLALECDFMSFGTNDLTQMTCGFSRDDAASFLGNYVKTGIYDRDPFVAIDQQGVGKLMKVCVALARGVNPKIDIGICGEHGGEPASVEFCHRIGLSNVSCSPFRVPVARLAAAHAAIKYGPQPVTLEVADIISVGR